MAAVVAVAASCSACNAQPANATTKEAAYSPRPVFQVKVHAPSKLTSIDVDEPGPGDRPRRISCNTCHGLREKSGSLSAMTDLKEFHVGLSFQHGKLACRACHAEGQPPRLHLADGSLLDTSQAIRLCAQCHGPQYDSYQHGAHGGMNGHWDLSRGPQVKNHCVDCHDPHTPAIRPVQPMPAPRDRFFSRGGSH